MVEKKKPAAKKDEPTAEEKAAAAAAKAESQQRVAEFTAALREGTPADAPFGELTDEERAEALKADEARKAAAVSEKAGA